MSSTATSVFLSLALVAPAHGQRDAHRAEADRRVSHADKVAKAGKFGEAIEGYSRALGEAAQIADFDTRYATANRIRLRIAEVHLDAHRIDHDNAHLDAAQAVLDEYVKVRDPEELDRAQRLYDEIDARRYPSSTPSAPLAAPEPTPTDAQVVHRPTSIARPMLIAGATLTVVGGIATSGMIAALLVQRKAGKDADNATVFGEHEDARHRQDSARAGAIASGVVALAAFTAGIPLLVVSLHRRRALRLTTSPAIGPGRVSFAVAGRF